MCGINLRNAPLEHAKKILSNHPDNVEMTLEHSPQLYYESGGVADGEGGRASTGSTPRATPLPAHPNYAFVKPYLSRESSVQSANYR